MEEEAKHKLWLIVGVVIALLAILLLVVYPSAKKALFGKAIGDIESLTRGELLIPSLTLTSTAGGSGAQFTAGSQLYSLFHVANQYSLCRCFDNVCVTDIACHDSALPTDIVAGQQYYKMVSLDNDCLFIQTLSSTEEVAVYSCYTFKLNVDCPASVAPGQRFTCEIILDRQIPAGDIFGAQFVVRALGLQAASPFVVEENDVSTYSAGIGGQTVLFKLDASATSPGTVAQLNFVAPTAGTYDISLDNLLLVSASDPDSIVVSGSPVVGGACSPTTTCAATQNGLPVACTNGVCGGSGSACSQDNQCVSGNCVSGVCVAVGREVCNNGIDDDRDTLLDCADVGDCGSDPACVVISAEVCNNGIDDDRDTFLDCADSDCASNAACLGGVLGDVNGDGRIDAIDAILILRNVVGIGTPLTDLQIARANVNSCQAGQASLDAVDAILILRRVVGLITTFPC